MPGSKRIFGQAGYQLIDDRLRSTNKPNLAFLTRQKSGNGFYIRSVIQDRISLVVLWKCRESKLCNPACCNWLERRPDPGRSEIGKVLTGRFIDNGTDTATWLALRFENYNRSASLGEQQSRCQTGEASADDDGVSIMPG